MRRLSAVLLAACLLIVLVPRMLSGAALQQQPASNATAVDPFAEYPSHESAVRDMLRAGLAAKKAAFQLAQSPDSPETAEALLAVASNTYYAQERCADSLRVIREIVQRHPEAIARTIEAVLRYSIAFDMDRAHDYRPALREVLDAARSKLPGLPRAEAADLAYQLVRMEAWLNRDKKPSTIEPLKALAQEYAGTEAALGAELDVLTATVGYSPDPTARVNAFDKFVRDHPGTCAAATALRSKAFALGHNLPAGQDPTDRFLPVFEIARQLDASPYRDCQTRAELGTVPIVAGMFAYKPAYGPGSIDRLLAAYREFVKSHFGPDAGDPNNGIGYIINSKMRELHRAKGEGVAALDRFLADLERQVAAPDAARYLRALIYFNDPMTAMPGSQVEVLPPDEARARLAVLHASGNGLYQRKALATLAWLCRYDGDTAKAREHYSSYVKLYPQSAYAWVAALRAGECAAELGDWKAAAAAYQAAARSYSSMPLARVLGHAYAGRALEALNQPIQALAEYQAAADGWDKDYGARYSFYTARKPPKAPAPVAMLRDDTAVTLEALTARVAQLKQTTAAAGGDVLEQGRWLIDHGKRKEAAQLLADFAKRYPRSTNILEAQYLAHKARLYDALETLNIEGADDEAAGVKALDTLATEPYDFAVCAAKMSRTIVLGKQGKQDEAGKLMGAALEEWRTRQKLQEPASALEKDVAEIRNVVFLPMGGSVYGSERWNAFSWPNTSPPFLVVNPEVALKFTDRPAARLSLSQRFPGLDNVLLINTEQIGFLNEMMTRLGGTKSREGRIFLDKGVMEAPNQPVGPSVNIIAFLAKFFEARPGHWGGWEFLTYPVISEIEFTNAERTTARARVVIGYSGCDVLLEKIDGTWKAIKLVNQWVT